MNQNEQTEMAVIKNDVKHIQEDFTEIKSDLRLIRTNELPHLKEQIVTVNENLQQEITKIDKKVAVIVAIATTIWTIISLLLKFYIK